jgi:CDGSH-type Zn-finger protein/truncated hemoglobin YjbI
MSDASSSAGGRGRLAQVIASRGGQAPPEAPFVIEHREALIYMLCEAAELEHGIMCQYLFAAFSLKQGVDEGLTQGELAAVTRWRRLVAHVATEEMLHLALVQNLLSAVGAAPHFVRPNLPAPASHYPAGVQLALVPFGEPALRHFMFLERPEGMQLKGAEGLDAAVAQAAPLMAEGDIVPRLQDFATVGHLYRSIEHGLAHLAQRYGERWLFVGPPRAQATAKDWRWPELVAVTDLASAQQAIDTILEQGEGARGDWQEAHFGQFVQILDEYRQMRADNPGFDPTRPVLSAKVRPGERDDGAPLIGDPITARCADLFNVGYEVLLQVFERYFAHTEETDAQLSTLAEATIAVMVRVLKPLGELITTLPAGSEHPGMTAGPSFELFYESDYLMPHREAAWTLLEERLRDASVFCTRIEGDADPSLCERLAPVEQALDDIADSLAAHFADWGAASRYTRSPDGSEVDAGDMEPMLKRAGELARRSAPGESADHATRGAAALFADAHALLRALAAGGDQTGLAAGGPGPQELAARLVMSVLRPLADAIDGPGPANAPAKAGARGVGIEESLWALAQTATELRVSSAANPRLAAPLAEAGACLQRLALRLAPADGPTGVEARTARLRELQADLHQKIEVAVDGPYLVANAGNVRNWLGESLPVAPQTALCRCGESKSKPFCDGTHAEVGFRGEKDRQRVPDRLDTYVGQQVTILDNRGLCQHSGFCSDRLAMVFRVDQEPFVAPSGGRMDEIIRAVRDCPSGALGYAIDGVEAQADVDHHGRREATIEVTKDGPYRITGGIPLTGARGRQVPRNAGASREHYALCRCGHSQNKPFCSGMHWYIEFHDPVPDPDAEPTMFEWCGGLPALTRMTRLFYEKLVPQDPLLAPLFANMSPDHPQRVAKWLGEVFGGPPCYSDEFGGYSRMLSQHVGKGLTEQRRARWVALLGQAAQEAGMPSDPEFRSAFNSYLEWGSRLAVENSQPGAKPPQQMPMPHWDWGSAGPPGSRISALAPESEDAEAQVELPAAGEPVSFEAHIKPLFRERDRKSMKFAFDLWSHDDVEQHAEGILERLRDGSMPCDGAWSPEKVDAFERWVQLGKPT